jgi:hypothetical protein
MYHFEKVIESPKIPCKSPSPCSCRLDFETVHRKNSEKNMARQEQSNQFRIRFSSDRGER